MAPTDAPEITLGICALPLLTAMMDMNRNLLCAALALASLSPAQSSWGTPTNVAALNSTLGEGTPHLSADGLTMHFNRYVSGTNWEIWSATRATPTSAWNAPVIESALNDPTATDGETFLRADGLEIFFSSSRPGTLGAFDVMRATRATTSSPWSAPAFVTELNTPQQNGAVSLTQDGLTLFMLSATPTLNNAQIYTATRPTLSSPFSTPALVPELSSTDATRDAEVSLDGLQIVYYRLVSGVADFYIASRKKRSDPFGTPEAQTSLRAPTGSSNLGGSISADRGTLFFIRISGGNAEIVESRFDGLAHAGIASVTSTMRLLYRDTGSAGLIYLGALALGGTGFPLGTRTVPLDPDGLFIASFGTGVPPFTSGYAGLLNASGEANATITCAIPAVVGLTVWTGMFTLDAPAPFGVKTISNSFALEFVP